jgi:hypothetical protein
MSDGAQKKSGLGRRFRLPDFLVILFCLSGAVYSVIMFRLDLSRNEEPVGTIIISNNIVQRRMANRALWDRLSVDSPVYSGDHIRTADISDATLYIERNSIDLNGKTLIRIQRSPEDEDSVLIYLDEGNLVLTTVAGGGNIALNLMGRQVEAGPLTMLSASVGKDGAVVQVSEGTATLTGDGQRREIAPGTMIALSPAGAERTLKAAVVLQPRPDARYLKDGPEPLFINFAWNRINLDPGEALCLEIAEDRNFKRIIRVIENLDTTAGAALNAGHWYWRLSLMPPVTGAAVGNDSDAILSTGRLTVADASGPALLSPVAGSLFRYQNKLPGLRFQWSEIAEASSYILEAAETPDFINPRLRTQTASIFLIDSSLGPGTWHWRVMPVFPPVYEGQTVFSSASFFRIEQGDDGVFVPVLPEPVIELTETPEPVPVLPAPLNRLPPTGHRIGIEQLRELNSIVFTWSAVQGANAYIFTLYEDTGNGLRQIIRVPPQNRMNWTLENLAALGSGVFIWQVEAVNRSSAGTIEQRGRIGENSFIMDIPQPGQVEIIDPGTLYAF